MTFSNSAAIKPSARCEIRFKAVAGLSPAPTARVSISTTEGNSPSIIARLLSTLLLRFLSVAKKAAQLVRRIRNIALGSGMYEKRKPKIMIRIRGNVITSCEILKFS